MNNYLLPDYQIIQLPNPKLVAREGLEPSKPQGRQIYSLLRLTAPQPRQFVFGIIDSTLLCADRAACSQGPFPPKLTSDVSRIFTSRSETFGVSNRWSWRRDLNPRPADYKSAALPD